MVHLVVEPGQIRQRMERVQERVGEGVQLLLLLLTLVLLEQSAAAATAAASPALVRCCCCSSSTRRSSVAGGQSSMPVSSRPALGNRSLSSSSIEANLRLRDTIACSSCSAPCVISGSTSGMAASSAHSSRSSVSRSASTDEAAAGLRWLTGLDGGRSAAPSEPPFDSGAAAAVVVVVVEPLDMIGDWANRWILVHNDIRSCDGSEELYEPLD
uniref:Uncharacterized protein n=1 Tax=Anopheles coluzzii TaxID=1518534 RepID=A0A8W7P2C5_ANOCL